MGQNPIFCLLTFFGTPKNLSDSSSCAGVPFKWKCHEGFQNRIPGTAVAIVASAGGGASISVKPVIPRFCAIPRLDVSSPEILLLKADDVWAKKPGSGE